MSEYDWNKWNSGYGSGASGGGYDMSSEEAKHGWQQAQREAEERARIQKRTQDTANAGLSPSPSSYFPGGSSTSSSGSTGYDYGSSYGSGAAPSVGTSQSYGGGGGGGSLSFGERVARFFGLLIAFAGAVVVWGDFQAGRLGQGQPANGYAPPQPAPAEYGADQPAPPSAEPEPEPMPPADEAPARPWIGLALNDWTPDGAETVPSGALVMDVAQGSPAADARIERGDAIVSLDGRAIRSAADVVDLITASTIAQPIAIEWISQGQRYRATITPTPRPR